MHLSTTTDTTSCTDHEPSPAVTPLGGVTDTCGICGLPIENPAGVGAVGLNGIVCRHCASELPERTPRVAAIVRKHQPDIRLYQYRGGPGSPYRDSIAGLVLCETTQMEDMTTNTTAACYQLLSEPTQRLLWQITTGAVPDTYTRFTGPALADGILVDAHLKNNLPDRSSGHPYLDVADRLPKPYAVTRSELYVNLRGDPLTAERVAQNILTFSPVAHPTVNPLPYRNRRNER